MPADVLRDREDAAPPTGFSDIAQAAAPDPSSRIQSNEREMGLAREKQTRAREDERAAMETRAAALKPQVASVEQAMGQREQLAANRPPPLALPPPPSRKLTDFLAPVEGEQPENTISKLLQGVGLLASGFTGLRRGNASTALASMAGALKGWHEGDKERADRHLSDWQNQTERLILENRSLQRTYEKIMEDADLNIGQKQELLKLKALEAGHEVGVATFSRQNADEDLKFLADYNKQLLTLQDHKDKVVAMAQRQREHDENTRLTRQLIASQKEQRREETLVNYAPGSPSLTMLAWKTIHDGGRVPNIGMAGPIGQEVRGRVLQEVGRLMQENNIPLSTLPAIGDEMKGWQNNINTAARQLAYWNANIDTFHKHAKQFLDLSDRVARGQSPVMNRVQLKYANQYAGDPGVAALRAMALEIAQEYAKLSVGTAQGDANSREAAREAINEAMNPEQLRAIIAQLVQAGENRKKSWEDSMKQGTENVTTFGGRLHAPLPPAGPDQPPALIWDATAGKLVGVPGAQ